MTLVGAPPEPAGVVGFHLIFKRRQLAGSGIGGIRETQEMLDFCAEHGITADIEKIDIQQINEAYERLLKSDVKYRFRHRYGVAEEVRPATGSGAGVASAPRDLDIRTSPTIPG